VRIGITLLPILRFFYPLSYGFLFALPFLGSLLVPPGPYPQADPNSRASDTVAHKELKQRHLNGALVIVVISELY
jgi:hypothetical protein